MILLFVGAGGSAAVDPKQYPTTVGFFEKLPDEMKGDCMFNGVCKFLKEQKGKEIIDIEDVLETLGELQADCERITDFTNITGWTLSGGRLMLPRIDIPSAALHSSIGRLETALMEPLSNQIKEKVYEFYGAPPAPNKLSAWIRLLKGLEKIDPVIEIFTTNYDLVLEDVIEEAKVKVDCGRDRSPRRTRLDPAFWNPSSPLFGTNRGLLTKLHGSVDWQHLNGDIIVGPSRFSGDHQNHCILYPGYKGVPTEEPFNAFHEHLRSVVQEEYGALTGAILIGFAFRDEYINSILGELPSETLVYLITKPERGNLLDKGIAPSVPFSATFTHAGGGLTEETVGDCLAYLSEKREKKEVAITIDEVGGLSFDGTPIGQIVAMSKGWALDKTTTDFYELEPGKIYKTQEEIIAVFRELAERDYLKMPRGPK